LRRFSQSGRDSLRIRQLGVAAAEREDAGRFIVQAGEKLTAFLELETSGHCQREVGMKLRESHR